MLLHDVRQTIALAERSLEYASHREPPNDLGASSQYIDSLGITEKEKAQLLEIIQSHKAKIDPAVLMLVGATSGHSYRHLVGDVGLSEYPIPQIQLPSGKGRTLLDLGCSWGRWSCAAAQLGYSVVGVDPSLGAVLAARRIADSLHYPNRYVVADARHLPFAPQFFHTVYSYSVLQHFSGNDLSKTLSEIGRVITPDGLAMIQMANAWGLRSFQHQLKRGFREPVEFEVRYRTVSALRRLFEEHIGPTTISVDCYFGLGWQWHDYRYMTWWLKVILLASELLRRLSTLCSPLRFVADSVFCVSRKSR